METTVESRGADLQLVFEPSAAGLKFSAHSLDDSFPEVDLPRHAQDARRTLYSDLLSFRQGLPDGVDCETADAEAALRLLLDKGRMLARRTFGSRTLAKEVIRFCSAAIPRPARTEDVAPLVEIRSPADAFLPVEFLPLFYTPWPEPLTEPYQLEEAAQAFLGFTAITRRVVPASADPDPILRNESTLHLEFFHGSGLSGAVSEREQFDNLQPHIAVTSDWPDGMSSRTAARHLSQRIYDVREIQVQHFSCHCSSGAPPASRWSLRLGQGNDIDLQALDSELFDLEERERPPRPLVFMNACGSSVVEPAEAISFVELFLENGNRGFIGTETRIPDEVAATVAKAFYRSLLLGATTGQALHNAKWTLLRRHNNPLGILYTLYGNPDLRIERALRMEELYV